MSQCTYRPDSKEDQNTFKCVCIYACMYTQEERQRQERVKEEEAKKKEAERKRKEEEEARERKRQEDEQRRVSSCSRLYLFGWVCYCICQYWPL